MCLGMSEKESSKEVILSKSKEGDVIVVEEDVLIVKSWDEMLDLLDNDWKVTEELGDAFIMRRERRLKGTLEC